MRLGISISLFLNVSGSAELERKKKKKNCVFRGCLDVNEYWALASVMGLVYICHMQVRLYATQEMHFLMQH